MESRAVLLSFLLLYSCCLGNEIEQKSNVADALVHYRLEMTSNFPTAFGEGISEQCLYDSNIYMEAYNNGTPWAYQSKI